MIDFFGYKANRNYFAAYNGYSGFGSFFNEIFSTDKHDRVFILKGGPGTGKSTLLKSLIKWANKQEIISEAIYCSSDPSSLDGAILKRGNKSIAVLDGTAPHTFDPKLPGAKDEIINLGEGFNTENLVSNAQIINSLGKKKSCAYQDAYSYLRIAGETRKVIDMKTERCINKTKLDSLTETLKEKLEGEESVHQHETFCISAFGRHGLTRLDSIVDDGKTVIGVSGDGCTEYYLMSRIASYLLWENKLLTLCPSPLDISKIEAISTENYLILTNSKSDIELETNSILTSSPDISSVQELYNTSLELAKEAFESASLFHFKMEDIYKEAVDFENNDRIFSSLTKKAKAILG